MRLPTLLLTAAVLVLPAAALAQHGGHGAEAHETSQGAADPHAEHAAGAGEDHSEHAKPPESAVDPHAGHHVEGAEQPVPPAADDAHAGHVVAPESSDPHAGHTMHGAAAAPPPPLAGPPPEAFSGPEHAADAHFGDTAMARARRDMNRMHGALPAYRVLIDRTEARLRNGRDAYVLDAQAWYGGDIDKLWIKGEAEGAFEGELEAIELQALWSRAIGPWFDLQTGLRYDVLEGEDRAHLVLGVQGLAPYWIEVDAAAFLSDQGDVTAGIEAEHDARITQRLILQPRAEVNFALQDIPERSVGSGLVSASLGARLRYEITPLFAPYLGVEYERTFGDTRSMRKAANEHAGGLSVLAGIRAWF